MTRRAAVVARRPSLFALVAGALLAVSLPPRGWWPLGVVAFATLATAVRRQAFVSRLRSGSLFAAGLFVPSLAWVTDFSLPGYVVLVAVQIGVYGAVIAAAPRRWPLHVALPAAVVLAEAVRMRWPLGGLPLASPALGQLDAPYASVAATGGPLALLAVAAVCGVVVAALYDTPRSWVAPAVTAVMVAALVVGSDEVGRTRPAGWLSVAAVQGGGPRGIPGVVADTGAVIDRHLEATAAFDGPVDVLLWPESVVHVDAITSDAAEIRALQRVARERRAHLVAGVVEDAGPGSFRNSAILWAPDGRVAGRYDKVRLVPFGEYVPARTFLERIVDLSLVPRDAVAGDGPGVLETPDVPLGVLVSYEVLFSDRSRTAARAGAEVLLVPTNAASFTGPSVPAQQVAAARLRARETGRALVQAAPTGHSAIISPSGELTEVSALETPAVLSATVPLRVGRTPYTVLGDVPVIGLSMTVLAGVWLHGRPSRHSSGEVASLLQADSIPATEEQ